MYAVVHFIKENAVEAVPKSWLSGANLCKWPPFKASALTKAIERRAPPEPEWNLYSVEVLKLTEDYEKARTKAKRAVNRGFSEMSSTDDNSKRKRVPAKKLCHSEEEEQPTPTEGETSKNLETSQDPLLSCSDSSDVIEDEPAVKKTKRVKKHHTLPPPPPVRPFPIASTSRTSEGPDLVGTKDMLPASQSQASTSSRDLKLFTLLEEIKGQVRQNSALLKGLLNKQHSALAPEQGMDLFTLPLRTEADVANMEDLLRDKNNQTTLGSYLTSLGGFTPRDVIGRIMAAIFTDALACQFNWIGRGGKTALSKLALAKVITDAVKKSSIKQAEAEQGVRNWLKYALDRNGGRKRRQERKQKEASDPEPKTQTSSDTDED